MMKNIFVLLIIVIFGPAVYAVNELDGIYYGEGGRIEICGNKFVFVKVIDNHDTKKLVTAVCFRENEHMFVIRQNKPDSMVRANAITEQSKVRMSDSNCRHVFVAFPDIENMELDISLTYRDDSVCGGTRQNDEFTTQKYIYSNMTDRNCG